MYHPLTKRQAEDHHRRESLRLRSLDVRDWIEDNTMGMTPKPEDMSLEFIERYEKLMKDQKKVEGK